MPQNVQKSREEDACQLLSRSCGRGAGLSRAEDTDEVSWATEPTESAAAVRLIQHLVDNN